MFGTNFKSKLPFGLLLLLLVAAYALGANGTLIHQRAKRGVEDGEVLAVPIDTGRLQLLKDALGWMTFRKNGQLMTNKELEPLFLNTLKKYYNSSKFFRTFVIAFQHGVLPRLTLNENEACDPEYTYQYKDPFNSSVTWHYQKNFTFKNYKERSSSDGKFCDYRQGLVCKPATQKCQCPEGSKMQPVSPNNPVRRCLLEENEICAVIDIDHGIDPQHSTLADNLYQIIFNLEKPIGCKQGTQCRFKSSDFTFSRCYNVNSGPWVPSVDKSGNFVSTWTLGFGRECVLGLIALPGSCPSVWYSDRIGSLGGYVCYNFGPPRSQRSSRTVTENRTGFCAHEYGPYGISGLVGTADHEPLYHPFFTPFVNPRTVPLRGSELEDFFRKYLILNNYLFLSGPYFDIMEEKKGARCSISKTERLEQSWSYFASLEDAPPPGEDYVPQATKTELYANLDPVVEMKEDVGKKLCQVYATYLYFSRKPSLQCVAQDPPDAAGNDGICQEPGKLDTKAFDERFQKFLEHVGRAEKGLAEQEEKYDCAIFLEYPDGFEPRCKPNSTRNPGSRVGEGCNLFVDEGLILSLTIVMFVYTVTVELMSFAN